MQRVNRELSSELIKSPVNPAFLHISTPFVNDDNPLFYLQLNGETLWEWRKLPSLDQAFYTLQNNLARIGYHLSSCSRTRIGKVVYNRVDYIVKKTNDPRNTSQRRKTLISQYWCRIALHPNEIAGPRRGNQRTERERKSAGDGESEITR